MALSIRGRFLESPDNFSGPKSQFSNCNPMVFEHVFNLGKSKRNAKFEGLEPPPCEHIKGIVAPEEGPKSLGTFEKQDPGPRPQAPIAEKVGKHYPLDEPLYSGQSAVKIRVAGWRNGHQPPLPPLRSL